MSALAALGVSELIAGILPGATSLVAAVGQVVIDLQPPGAKDLVVTLFGTNDKLALELFVVAVGPLIGALLGILARRRFDLAALGFAAFGVLGFLAALGDPLANPAIVAASAAVSVGVALWLLGWFLGPRPAGTAPGVAVPMPDWSRRSFLLRTGAVGAGAVVAGVGGRQLLERQRVAPSGAGAAIPPASETGAGPGRRRGPGRVGAGPDPDRHAQRALLPDRHRAPDAERRHERLDAAHPRPGRSRDHA